MLAYFVPKSKIIKLDYPEIICIKIYQVSTECFTAYMHQRLITQNLLNINTLGRLDGLFFCLDSLRLRFDFSVFLSNVIHSPRWHRSLIRSQGVMNNIRVRASSTLLLHFIGDKELA